MDTPDRNLIRIGLTLSNKRISALSASPYITEHEIWLKKAYFDLYIQEIKNRNAKPVIGEKEKKLLSHTFNWCISSKEFNGDLHKGLYLASKQGFGKDIILATIVKFFAMFDYSIKEISFPKFNIDWYELGEYHFVCPIKINDVSEAGKMKRERESIPFLEFLDHREQINNRRGILVSSNYTPEALQNILEADRPVKRLLERIKECFNIIVITEAESKRIINKIEI